MKDTLQPAEIRSTLSRLGELLAQHGEQAAIVVVGGAALNLLGVVSRATVDVDVIALGVERADGPPQSVTVPDALPPVLEDAGRRLSRDLGLGPGWLNTTVTSGGRLILPPGFAARVTWTRHGGLWLGPPRAPSLGARVARGGPLGTHPGCRGGFLQTA